MIEELKKVKTLFIENKIKLLFIFLSSSIFGFFYIQKYNPTFKAEFEIAPYFEMASDLGGELKKINEAINQHDINYIQNKLGKIQLDYNQVIKAVYSKKNKGLDYSFKHINLKMAISFKDTSNLNLKELDIALVNFCNSYIKDTVRSCRGIIVYKEKLKMLSENQFVKIKNDSVFDFYKSHYNRENIILSPSTINKIVYAQTMGEYKSVLKTNYYSHLDNSIQIEQRQYTKLELFAIIATFPVFIFIIILRSVKYDN